MATVPMKKGCGGATSHPSGRAVQILRIAASAGAHCTAARLLRPFAACLNRISTQNVCKRSRRRMMKIKAALFLTAILLTNLVRAESTDVLLEGRILDPTHSPIVSAQVTALRNGRNVG